MSGRVRVSVWLKYSRVRALTTVVNTSSHGSSVLAIVSVSEDGDYLGTDDME